MVNVKKKTVIDIINYEIHDLLAYADITYTVAVVMVICVHEDYPCRYYYLDMSHPKSLNIDECRFKHGGPLSRQLSKYFKRQIEEWVKKLTNNKPDEFDNILRGYIKKFDEKQFQLEQEYGVKESDAEQTTSTEQSAFEHVLSVDQIKLLAENNITNVAQLNRVSVDELMDYGLTVDQIYKITIETCQESNRMSIDQTDAMAHHSSYTEPISNSSSSSIETVDVSSFECFCNHELNEPKDELQSKKLVTKEGKTVDDSALNANEYDQEKVSNVVKGDGDSSDDSKDSDDEMNLLIDEDIKIK